MKKMFWMDETTCHAKEFKSWLQGHQEQNDHTQKEALWEVFPKASSICISYLYLQ